jgi:hypothetical protein
MPHTESTITVVDAGVTVARGTTADASGDPPPISRRHRSLQEQVDDLLGDDLIRAKELCSAKPAETKESCIDAALQARSDEREARMLRSARALRLLQEVGNADCSRLARNSSEKNACVLESMNRRLGELEGECPGQPGDLQHDCLMQAVLRHFGP